MEELVLGCAEAVQVLEAGEVVADEVLCGLAHAAQQLVLERCGALHSDLQTVLALCTELTDTQAEVRDCAAAVTNNNSTSTDADARQHMQLALFLLQTATTGLNAVLGDEATAATASAAAGVINNEIQGRLSNAEERTHPNSRHEQYMLSSSTTTPNDSGVWENSRPTTSQPEQLRQHQQYHNTKEHSHQHQGPRPSVAESLLADVREALWVADLPKEINRGDVRGCIAWLVEHARGSRWETTDSSGNTSEEEESQEDDGDVVARGERDQTEKATDDDGITARNDKQQRQHQQQHQCGSEVEGEKFADHMQCDHRLKEEGKRGCVLVDIDVHIEKEGVTTDRASTTAQPKQQQHQRRQRRHRRRPRQQSPMTTAATLGANNSGSDKNGAISQLQMQWEKEREQMLETIKQLQQQVQQGAQHKMADTTTAATAATAAATTADTAVQPPCSLDDGVLDALRPHEDHMRAFLQDAVGEQHTLDSVLAEVFRSQAFLVECHSNTLPPSFLGFMQAQLDIGQRAVRRRHSSGVNCLGRITAFLALYQHLCATTLEALHNTRIVDLQEIETLQRTVESLRTQVREVEQQAVLAPTKPTAQFSSTEFDLLLLHDTDRAHQPHMLAPSPPPHSRHHTAQSVCQGVLAVIGAVMCLLTAILGAVVIFTPAADPQRSCYIHQSEYIPQ
ncbi:hypothetical protein PTSG_02576 [Salpingoeca rosetta]|uniref:Uncharacterized protein n=1 Tax=Salpingoeca rosetta (strain ATCC 50818 / BSB-021) TaxID=946362 RepID=F2U2P6_SALR5|nr:uncharacterized protein PTSG_02576 [Salpingoeca rosetta]EGD81890.1 hypothetical protein PTSG_02576 [Salpingoeca rosetta]|eukprot:XP_004996073.1 hypothetical protein PTSG_02576 [Salpingoeca rosetta]